MADGGLALTIKTEDSLSLPPDEDERPSQGYQMNENKKDVNIEPEQFDPDASYMFIQSERYAHPPIMDQMPTDQRIALLSDAVSYLIGNTDPGSQEMLQNMLDACHNLRSSKSASSAPTAKPVEEAPAADAAMEDAAEDSPAKIADDKKVDLEEDEIDYDFDSK